MTARFDGDALYAAATTSADVLLYRMPDGGVFAVGDGAASGDVTFWSRSWRQLNPLTGGRAPDEFKGFTHPTATGWTAQPGFKNAPTAVPEWMGVIVTHAVTKRHDAISGAKPPKIGTPML